MLKSKSLVFCLIVLSSIMGFSAPDLALNKTSQETVFGDKRFAVRFDNQTGWPGAVICDDNTVIHAADTKQCFDLREDEKWITGGAAPVELIEVVKLSPDTARSRMRVGNWTVDAMVQLFPQERMLRRWFEISWNGKESSKIKGFWFQDGVLQLKKGGSYFCPAAYPPRITRTVDLVEKHKTRNGRSPCPVIADTGEGWSVLWVSNELTDYADRGGVSVEESVGSIRVTRSYNMQGHVRKGTPQKVGDSWIWIAPCDGETLLKRMPEWFSKVGQMPLDDRPEWLKRVVLYSFHPGGTMGSGCKDLGGFKPATELLSDIRDLGCNAIWLMPLEDKSIYWPRDYYKLQEGLGTPDDYKALTAKAHSLGMRVWQDCVPHGGCNEYQRAKEHPEWLAQKEDGSTLYYWCFDFNWPSWIQYMSDVVSFYTKEYDLDGFRIDACSGSKIPNWNPDIPYARASHAQALGGIAMQEALRKAVKTVNPDGANLAEAGSSLFGATSDSTYDFSLCYSVLHDFRMSPVKEFVPNLRRWLHEQQYSEIPDLVRMRHLESHDSLRSGLWYGAAPQRALMALISWIHGIPMVYHEMEEGNTEYFRRIFYLRHHIAELNVGEADYLGVKAPEGVFACLRSGQIPSENDPGWHQDYQWDVRSGNRDRVSVVLINLNGEAVDGEVRIPVDSLPESLRSCTWLRDMVNGEKLELQNGQVEISLPPFGYTVLRPGSQKLPALKPLGKTVAAPDVELPAESHAVKCNSGKLIFDKKTSLPVAWKKGLFSTVPLNMDLALPESMLAPAVEKTTSRILQKNVFENVRKFDNSSLKIRYEKDEEAVRVTTRWDGAVPGGAALLLDLPAADLWSVTSAEGRFESPFSVRHKSCDGIMGSIYRLPQGTATLWDSRLHPFGLDAAHATVRAFCGNQTLAFQFNPDQLPASVQILDRIGDNHGMKLLIRWCEDFDGLGIGGNTFSFTIQSAKKNERGPETGTGDKRLVQGGGGWSFENKTLRVSFTRNGYLCGVWRREGPGWKCVADGGGSYSDRGYASGKRYAQKDDVETFCRMKKDGSKITVSFFGALRGFYRFDKMRHPIRFFTEYSFDEADDFGYVCAVRPAVMPADSRGFLSTRFRTCGIKHARFTDADGLVMEGNRPGKHARYVETSRSKNPGRLPTSICLSDGETDTLCIGNVRWFGALPANLFMYEDDLHLAWMDGPVAVDTVAKWNGMRCRIGFDDKLSPVDGGSIIPTQMKTSSFLLKDGDFNAGSSEKIALLLAGTRLPSLNVAASKVWSLPEEAERVDVDGKRCMKITGNGKDYRLIRQALIKSAFKPGSKWRARALIKSQGIEKGDQGWKTACLRWALRIDGRSMYESVSIPIGNSDWLPVYVDVTIPDKLESISVEAGLNGNAGIVWVDDVTVFQQKGNR